LNLVNGVGFTAAKRSMIHFLAAVNLCFYRSPTAKTKEYEK